MPRFVTSTYVDFLKIFEKTSEAPQTLICEECFIGVRELHKPIIENNILCFNSIFQGPHVLNKREFFLLNFTRPI